MWTLPLLIIGVAVALSIPGGYYIAWIMDGRYRVPRWLGWFEARLNIGPQSWKQYLVALMLFNTVMFVVGFMLLAIQPYAPSFLNPDDKKMLGPTTIFGVYQYAYTATDHAAIKGDYGPATCNMSPLVDGPYRQPTIAP